MGNLHGIHKIHLDKEKETLLITLYAKALDNRSKNPILHDSQASAMVDKIDYDFERLRQPASGNIMVVRAKQFDTWLNAFLDIYPNAIVLNLGCGLDTRISRIDPHPNVHWYDVDYPEVIRLRKLFFSERNGYKMIATSVTETEWLENLPKDKPVMIIAEGLLEYLTKDEVTTLLHRLTGRFAHGQIAFDVMNSFAIKSGKENLKETTGAEHKWAVDDLRDVDGLNPELKRVAVLSVFSSKFVRKLPLKYRLTYTGMRMIPGFRNMMRLVLYKF